MGIVFSERGRDRGLFISDLPRTGEAARSGLLRKGDVLTYVGETKMSKIDFDQAMGILANTIGTSISLKFKRRIHGQDAAASQAQSKQSKHSKSGKSANKSSNFKKVSFHVGNTVTHLNPIDTPSPPLTPHIHPTTTLQRASSNSSRNTNRSKNKTINNPSITQQMMENIEIICGGNGKSSNFNSSNMPGACGGLFQVTKSGSADTTDLSYASGNSTITDYETIQSSFYSSDGESNGEREENATIMSEGSAPDQQGECKWMSRERTSIYIALSIIKL